MLIPILDYSLLHVLVIRDFNVMFTFVVASWEEITHDSRVRYSLGDFRQRRALTSKEKFNHVRAKLRNIIERVFGILKARFPILKMMASFSLVTQRNITLACFTFHNFIRREGLSDEYFARYDEPNFSVRNNNMSFDDDEDEIPKHDTAADREHITRYGMKLSSS
ncbi:hypothetical protein Lser_V15G11969 [Lactuca serriola]